jgi:hypothetical protein
MKSAEASIGAGRHQQTLLLGWLLLSLVMLIADWYVGTTIQFPFFILPVGLAVWYSGIRWGIALATLIPILRQAGRLALHIPEEVPVALANTGIRIAGLIFFALLIGHVVRQNQALARRIDALEGLLPICAHCKKIRDSQNDWLPVEQYITDRSKASFTHGICPDCVREHFDDLITETATTSAT